MAAEPSLLERVFRYHFYMSIWVYIVSILVFAEYGLDIEFVH